MLWGHRGLVGLFINKFIRGQGLRVLIPSPTFTFEECIVRVEKKRKKKEEEEEEEDRQRVNREERGRRRRHLNQERLRERLWVRFEDD